MKKSKQYYYTRFPVEVLREAIELFRAKTNQGKPAHFATINLKVGESEWGYDSSDEFFADYRKATGGVFYHENSGDGTVALHFQTFEDGATVSVGALDRGAIEAVFEVFERNIAISRLPV